MKSNEKKIIYHTNDTHSGGTLIDETQGAVNDFSMGISEYFAEEFGTVGVHDDQEGFYVIEGSGVAKIGENIFDISQGDSFVVPAGVEHILKKNREAESLKVLWAHGAV